MGTVPAGGHRPAVAWPDEGLAPAEFASLGLAAALPGESSHEDSLESVGELSAGTLRLDLPGIDQTHWCHFRGARVTECGCSISGYALCAA